MTTRKAAASQTKTDGEQKHDDDSKKPLQPITIQITRKNYYQLAIDWHVAAGTSFIVSRFDGATSSGYKLKKCMIEFGAWRAWLLSKGIRTWYMDRHGYDQVPTQWPHQFDASWSEAMSMNAGNKFFDEQVAKENSYAASRTPEALARMEQSLQRMKDVR